MKKRALERYIPVLLVIFIFLFFLLFFYKVHPLVLFDMDDWLYSYSQRDVVLQWGKWNPTRVLPEILMPLVTLVGRFGFDLFVQDHFRALSLSYAVTMSFFITVMCYGLYRLLEKSNGRLILLLYFLICHFWIYRTADSKNMYMFLTTNVTCIFFYEIPNLLSCILVLWIMQMQKTDGSILKGFRKMSNSKRSAFVFFIFFGIYSNLWASIILAVYISVVALFDGIQMLFEKRFSLIGYLKMHIIEICIVVLWAIQQIFEINGGRAASLNPGPYMEGLHDVLRVGFGLLQGINKYFFVSAIVILVLAMIVLIAYKDKQAVRHFFILLTCFLIIGLYLILSCARTGAQYLDCPQVHYCGFFFGMMILIFCADNILQYIPVVKTILPLFLAFVVCNCNTGGKTYLESTVGDYPPDACVRVCNDIMQQFLDAESKGETQIVLEIPDFLSTRWPIADYTGNRFSMHFYKMGITEKIIEVTELRYTAEKNFELHIAEKLFANVERVDEGE